MLLQTNSYVVPRDRKGEHGRLVRRFRQTFARLGCDSFDVYEQVGANWSAGESSGRFVQIMRFRDRRHQLAVQEAERNDPDAQALIAEFCELINFPYQRQQGLFAVGFYIGVLPHAPRRQPELVDKTAAVDELEEDTAGEHTGDSDAAEKKPAAQARPAALVEPGAATRSPIVTPVTPGQVPIITPAPVEVGEPADVELTTSPDETGQTSPIEFESQGAVEPEPIPVSGSTSPEELLAEATAEPTSTGNWQTSDGLDEELEGDGEFALDPSDTDDAGNIRVADPELLQAESDFAEYVADPVGAFDELKPKPQVMEGTLLEDPQREAESIPLNDDRALEALQLPDAAGGPPALPRLNGEIGEDLLEPEIENFREEDSDTALQELPSLEETSAEEHKTPHH